MLCCCFGVRLPVCSVSNSAELLHHALAEVWTARAAIVQICNGAAMLCSTATELEFDAMQIDK